MYIAKKQHQPRIKGIVQIKNLKSQLDRMEGTSNQLKTAKDKCVNDIKKLQVELDDAVQKIKVFNQFLQDCFITCLLIYYSNTFY